MLLTVGKISAFLHSYKSKNLYFKSYFNLHYTKWKWTRITLINNFQQRVENKTAGALCEPLSAADYIKAETALEKLAFKRPQRYAAKAIKMTECTKRKLNKETLL